MVLGARSLPNKVQSISAPATRPTLIRQRTRITVIPRVVVNAILSGRVFVDANANSSSTAGNQPTAQVIPLED